MKKRFSVLWASSRQPRKQRKYRANAPLHLKQKMVASHLDKPLRQRYKRRALPVRKGDEVAVMTGSFRGKAGTVSSVSLGEMKVYVEGIKRKKASGQEMDVGIDPSNLKITKLYVDDKKRRIFKQRQIDDAKQTDAPKVRQAIRHRQSAEAGK